jgi:hypothetical protein
MEKILRLIFIILIFIVLIFIAFVFDDYPADKEKLIGGYEFERIGETVSCISDGDKIVVNSDIKCYEYNDDYILVLQDLIAHGAGLQDDTTYYPDGNDNIYYWVLEPKRKLKMGPLSRENYLHLLDSLKIDLKLDDSKYFDDKK